MDETSKRISEKKYQRMMDMYDEYMAHTKSKEEYVVALLDLLDGYIKYRIMLKKRTVSAEYEDLMQQGRLAVLEQIDTYNPHQSKPSSFFTQYIDQYTREITRNEGMTNYYSQCSFKLDKVAKQYGYEDFCDSRLSADTLSILAEVPLMTVLETRKNKETTCISLEATSDNLELESSFKNPEKALLDAEMSEFLYSQYMKCTELERFLLDNLVLADKPVSYRTLLIQLKTPEMRQKFKKELPLHPDQVFLEQKTNHVLRSIRFNPRLKALNKNDIEPEIDIIEQASVEDIEANIVNNFISL